MGLWVELEQSSQVMDTKVNELCDVVDRIYIYIEMLMMKVEEG